MTKYDVAAQMDSGEWLIRKDTEYNFDAENGVLCLYEGGSFAYVNFDKLIQVSASPVRV